MRDILHYVDTMLEIFHIILGFVFIALVGVLIMEFAERFAEKHNRLIWVLAGVLSIPYLLMCLDMMGLL